MFHYSNQYSIFMQSNQEGRHILEFQWTKIYTSKDSRLIFVGTVEDYASRKEGGHFFVYNKSYVKKITSAIIQAAKKRTVFLPFDGNQANFTNSSTKQLLFQINLDQEEIIRRQDIGKITQKFFEKGEEQNIQSQAHPVKINTSPICRNHSLLLMYPDEQLPQIVGSDIVLLLLNIFKVLPGIKIGYNSIGAASSINHLHFHLLYAQDLIKQHTLPIQLLPRIPWLKSSLLNPHQQINLYSVGIRIQRIQSPVCDAFSLSPITTQQQIELSQATNSLSFVFGIIVNELIQLCIPHNVLFTDKGPTIYIILRSFAHQACSYGWLEQSGIIPFSTEAYFTTKEEEIIKLKQSIRVEAQVFAQLQKNISKNLQTFL